MYDYWYTLYLIQAGKKLSQWMNFITSWGYLYSTEHFNYISAMLQSCNLQCNIVEILQEHITVIFYEKYYCNISKTSQKNSI